VTGAIQVFKMFKGFENIDPCMFFRLNTVPTTGHSLKLIRPGCHLDGWIYGVVFMIKIIACNSINGFKAKIDIIMYGRGFI